MSERGIEIHNGKVIIPKDALYHGKKIYWGYDTVTGIQDVDLTSEFSAIDHVLAGLYEDPVITGQYVSAKVGGVAGHIDLKVWKPTAADGAVANVTPIAGTTPADVEYIVIGDPT